MGLIDGPHTRMPGAKAGRAIVAEGNQGRIVLDKTRRLTWGERMFGGYDNYYLVDMTKQTVELSMKLPSKLDGFAFDAIVSFDLQILDPVWAVEKNITDANGHVKNVISSRLKRLARAFDISESRGAAAKFEEALETLKLDAPLVATNWSVTVDADDAAIATIRDISSSDLHIRAEKARIAREMVIRDDIRSSMTSIDGLLIHWHSTSSQREREQILKMIDRKLSEIEGDKQLKIEILKHAIDRGRFESDQIDEAFGGFLTGIAESLAGSSSKAAAALTHQPDEEVSRDNGGPSTPEAK